MNLGKKENCRIQVNQNTISSALSLFKNVSSFSFLFLPSLLLLLSLNFSLSPPLTSSHWPSAFPWFFLSLSFIPPCPKHSCCYVLPWCYRGLCMEPCWEMKRNGSRSTILETEIYFSEPFRRILRDEVLILRGFRILSPWTRIPDLFLSNQNLLLLHFQILRNRKTPSPNTSKAECLFWAQVSGWFKATKETSH